MVSVQTFILVHSTEDTIRKLFTYSQLEIETKIGKDVELLESKSRLATSLEDVRFILRLLKLVAHSWSVFLSMNLKRNPFSR